MQGEARPGRILVYPPGHPMLVTFYITLAIIVALFTSNALALMIVEWGGLGSMWLALTIQWLVFLSPPLSFVNIVIARIRTGYVEQVLEIGYVEAFGIPIPVPRIRLVERVTLLAVNVGGALVPILVSGLLLYVSYANAGRLAFEVAGVAVLVTSLITYATSKTIPGVGIAVPGLVPPLVSAITTISLTGSGPLAASAAYVGGTLGSLIGADVLRLYKDLDKLTAPVVSIGGAGVFDGVFLSGIIAAFLAF